MLLLMLVIVNLPQMFLKNNLQKGLTMMMMVMNLTLPQLPVVNCLKVQLRLDVRKKQRFNCSSSFPSLPLSLQDSHIMRFSANIKRLMRKSIMKFFEDYWEMKEKLKEYAEESFNNAKVTKPRLVNASLWS